MTKLAILSLAATILVPASLAAQTVAPPVPWQDVPPAPLAVPGPPSAAMPPPGVTWSRPAPPAPVARVAPAPVPLPPPSVAAPTPAPAPAMRGRTIVHGTPGVRVQHGFVMPPFWLGPRFHIRDWRAFGFVAPAPGQQWVRYYDDAVLVDRYGRVIDTRRGLDWDEYDDEWRYDERGIPVYVGDGDFYPDGDDYAYVEDRGEAYADGYGDHGEGYPPPGECRPAYGHGAYPPPPCGYGGYGYGWGGGVTVTETIVTTYGGCCTEERVIVEEPRPKRRYRKYGGERG